MAETERIGRMRKSGSIAALFLFVGVLFAQIPNSGHHQGGIRKLEIG